MLPVDVLPERVDEKGTPRVRGRVEVAHTRRTTLIRADWSGQPASKPQSSSEYGVGQVEVGVLPDADWVENSPLSLEPLPAVWRFVVSRRNSNDPETLAAVHATLSTDQVFIFEFGKSVAADEFQGQTCGYDPWTPRAVTRAVAVVLVIAVVLAAGVFDIRHARRRHLKP